MDMREFVEEMIEITGSEPEFKNSLDYASRDWRPYSELTVDYPIQRKLYSNECVLDLDKISKGLKMSICKWLDANGLKFTAWESSDEGLHIHFFCNYSSHEAKVEIVKRVGNNIYNHFNVQNDINPMRQEFIRAEFSFKPMRKAQKRLFYHNRPILFAINFFFNVPISAPNRPISNIKNSLDSQGRMPQCMRYILSHRFTDGRKRLLFVVASWYKANGYEDVVGRSLDWARKQDLFIGKGTVESIVKSTNGQVGCSFRHQILEELGIDMSRCEYE